MLFSDIEGSTLLLSRLGARYAEALDAQRSVLRRAWSAWGGVEMGTEGDSFFVVFGVAGDGVRAALQAQHDLASQQWPAVEELRVRIGIHTGEPVLHGDGYVGIDVVRAARLSAAAHGGQLLVTAATWQLIADSMPRDEAESLAHESGSWLSLAFALVRQADLVGLRGLDVSRSIALCEEMERLAQERGDENGVIWGESLIADHLSRVGRGTDALVRLRTGAAGVRRMSNRSLMIRTLASFAIAFATAGDAERAAILLGAHWSASTAVGGLIDVAAEEPWLQGQWARCRPRLSGQSRLGPLARGRGRAGSGRGAGRRCVGVTGPRTPTSLLPGGRSARLDRAKLTSQQPPVAAESLPTRRRDSAASARMWRRRGRRGRQPQRRHLDSCATRSERPRASR